MEQVVEDIDFLWADSTRCLGGERSCCCCSKFEEVFLKVRLGGKLAGEELDGEVIGCGDRGDLGSVWKRVFRWNDWRGGRGGVGSESGIWRLLEIHFWISDSMDDSIFVSDLFRVWFAAVLDKISPLVPSTALCL